MAAAGQAAPEHARQTTAFGAQDRGVFTVSVFLPIDENEHLYYHKTLYTWLSASLTI